MAAEQGGRAGRDAAQDAGAAAAGEAAGTRAAHAPSAAHACGRAHLGCSPADGALSGPMQCACPESLAPGHP